MVHPLSLFPRPLVAAVASSLVALAALGDCGSVHAAPLTFNFNTLCDGANNAAVQAYMQDVVNGAHPGGTVTVHGARAEADYTGDDHVVGPVRDCSVTPLTLGNTDGGIPHGGRDTFLVNSGSDRITVTFSFPVYEVSFDYQIFPDATMPDGTCQSAGNSNWPDFKFRADEGQQFRTVGIMPGEEGTYAHSPVSGPDRPERAPQFLGASGTWSFPTGVTKLEFVDWPRLIGIDNLRVNDQPPDNHPCTPMPEPASLVLLGSGLVGLAVLRRRQKRSLRATGPGQ